MSTINGTGGNDVLDGDLADGLSLNNGATNHYAQVADYTDMPTSAISVEMEFTGVRPGHSQALMSYAVTGSDNELLLWDSASTDTIGIHINGTYLDTGIASDTVLNTSTHMFSFTWDSTTGTFKAYVDGVLKFTGNLEAGNPITAGGSLVLGQEQDNVGGGFATYQIYEGTIGEVRIFDDIRTDAEIAANANQEIADPTTEPNLVSNWQMNVLNNNPIYDATDNHNEMYVYNGAEVTGGVDDTITGGTGDDIIHGFSGNDTIDGGDGADTIYGGGDYDTILGGAGDDIIYGDGHSGLSLNTSATDEYAQVAAFDDMPTTAFSIELTLTGDTLAHSQSLLSYATPGSNNEILLWASSNGTYYVHINGASKSTGISTSSFLDNTEHQLTTTWDSVTGALKVYVDGTLQYSGTHQTGNALTAGGSLIFGQEQDSVGGNFDANQIFEGTLNEVRIFDDVRTAAEVLANTGTELTSPSTEPGLVANWQMDQTGVGVVVDQSGNGNGLVLHNGAEVIDLTGEDTDDRDDEIDGGLGNDTIYGNGGADAIAGGDGNDTIYGDSGADKMAGDAGTDTIYGGTGNDVLDGGAGVDDLYGEDDEDLFLVTGNEGFGDTIDGGTGGSDIDTLDLSNASAHHKIITSVDADGDSVTGIIQFIDNFNNIIGTLDFTEIEKIICFASGTRIHTPHGERAVEDLQAGDLVVTKNNGVQPIRWSGKRTVPGHGKFAPILFKKGSFNNSRDLLVSPQHRMLVSGAKPQLWFGESEILATAKHLINGTDVVQRAQDLVTWHHLLFDQHEIIFAQGSPSESFHLGAQGLDAIDAPQREELFALFPELRANPGGYGDSARISLKGFEAKLLAA